MDAGAQEDTVGPIGQRIGAGGAFTTRELHIAVLPAVWIDTYTGPRGDVTLPLRGPAANLTAVHRTLNGALRTSVGRGTGVAGGARPEAVDGVVVALTMRV